MNIVNFKNKDLNCTLNLTDIKNNNNKFYTISVLSNDNINYTLITRYGRVGYCGVEQKKNFNNIEQAYREFKKIFRTKTSNNWECPFVPKKGKYFLMELEQPDEDIVDDNSLDPRITDLLKKISNKEIFLKTYSKIGIDSKKCPLGKIDKSQIEKSYEILNDIKTNIETYDGEDFIDLSSQFWTLIPYNTGKNRPPVIDTYKKIKIFTEMVDSIKEIEISNNIIKNNKSYLDIYHELNCELYPIHKDSDEFDLIKDYIFTNMGSTHYQNYEILDILSLEKDEPLNNEYQTKLLFHGSRTSNYLSIIKNGLRIPNPSNVCHGSVLGYGIYFADCSTKSLNYCHLDSGDVGCLLLCEVAFSKTEDNSDVHFTDKATFDIRPESNYLSRIAMGKYSSMGSYLNSYLDNIEVPIGNMDVTKNVDSGFLYNEYVIYSKNLYRFKYIILIKKI